jgi:hypothetical protein
MMGLVLGLLWRQISRVNELVRVVQRERLLWVEPLPDLTQQAVAQRLRCLPAELFERVLNSLLPVLQARWQARQRPVPPVVAWAHARYTAVLIADGSTLDVLLRKIGWRRERRLYFVVGAQQHDPTVDPVRYLAEQAKPLGLIKRPRKPPKQKAQAPLDSA